ncbi:putative proteasome 26S regulatory subunit [Babesia divergens]|uniref:Proteasome 26S regulatory subunit n=1 Tax=Babesia divergens TaxID=32595 RepID=A0AAD9LH14_BABDI|nr:putative proteasome 26S regulatory subunit [Babesia divergens]
MVSKVKDELSESDAAYKEELDALVHDLALSGLREQEAEPLLLQLVNHATLDAGNITSVPKALQFLIEHNQTFLDIYNNYIDAKLPDSYSLFLLLELMSFLAAIATPDHDKSKAHVVYDDPTVLKLMLYKVEAGLVAERLLTMASTSDHVREKLMNRKINDWGNEYLTSFTTQIVLFFNMPRTRELYDHILHTSEHMDVVADHRDSILRKFELGLVITEVLKYAEAITDYFFQNGFEYEAIDLLLEVDLIESVRGKCGNDYDLISRVTSYMMAISSYAATHVESSRILTAAYDILLEAQRYSEALRIALKLDDTMRVKEVIFKTTNRSVRKQLILICNTHGFLLDYSSGGTESVYNLTEEEVDEINSLTSGEQMSALFLTLGAELDVLEPKTPKDIFKSYARTKGASNLNDVKLSKVVSLDTALGNLANTLVNAFINCGFGNDELLSSTESEWVFHHDEFGMLTAAASVGIVSLWNVDEGLSKANKFEYSTNSYIKGGAYAAYGLSCCGIIPEADPIAGLLLEKLEVSDFNERLGAILGLAFAYAGSCRENILMQLVPIAISDDFDYPIHCSCMAAVALGIMFVGSGKQEASEAVIQRLLDMPNGNSNMPVKHLLACSLGLLQLGRMDAAEVVIEALGAVDGMHGRIAAVMVEACAYAGTGDVLCIQRFLKYCSKIDAKTNVKDDSMDVDSPVHQGGKSSTNVTKNGSGSGFSTGKKSSSRKSSKVAFNMDEDAVGDKDVMVNEASIAIIGIALVALGDPVGCGMLLRLLEQPLQHGSPCERRSVPLAFAIAFASNPNPQVVDILSKLTHDNDYYVSMHATFALGIVGCGTNNSRIAVLLQNMSRSHSSDGTMIFVIRVAAGLLHMGKGTTTISSLHSEGFLIRKVALAGLLVAIVSALDIKSTFASSMPYTLLFITLAIRPRWFITVSPDLEHLPIACRVGNMVETTGTVGKQRRISGFQTHQTPVLVGVNERAELTNEEYIPCTAVLEGIVILEKNDTVAME